MSPKVQQTFGGVWAVSQRENPSEPYPLEQGGGTTVTPAILDDPNSFNHQARGDLGPLDMSTLNLAGSDLMQLSTNVASSSSQYEDQAYAMSTDVPMLAQANFLQVNNEENVQNNLFLIAQNPNVDTPEKASLRRRLFETETQANAVFAQQE